MKTKKFRKLASVGVGLAIVAGATVGAAAPALAQGNAGPFANIYQCQQTRTIYVKDGSWSVVGQCTQSPTGTWYFYYY